MDSERITKEQIENARSANLAEYFQSHGYECELRKDELHVKGFGGFYINTETNQWTCFGESKGGSNSVNCLVEMLGMDFKTAVRELAGSVTTYTSRRREKSSFSEKKKDLVLPEQAADMKRVFAYLCKTRGIKPELVSQLAHDKLLYQDTRGNAVFVHKDNEGKVVGAEIQGTMTDKRYKGVARGTSDSVFSVQVGDSPNKVYCFESSIDLLSFKQLANPDKINNSLLVSMAGLKPNSIKRFADKGMKIYSCVDNDEAGRKFTEVNGLTPCRRILEENGVKDYNELLQKGIEKPPPAKEKKSSVIGELNKIKAERKNDEIVSPKPKSKVQEASL